MAERGSCKALTFPREFWSCGFFLGAVRTHGRREGGRIMMRSGKMARLRWGMALERAGVEAERPVGTQPSIPWWRDTVGGDAEDSGGGG